MKAVFIFLLCIKVAVGQECNPKFAPDYIKGQYAGSIGFISAGAGYSFFKSKLQAELMFGFTPVEKYDDLFSLTLKINAKPFDVKIDSAFSTSILYGGIYFSNTFGEYFYNSWPEHYDKGYYYHTQGLRTGIFLGTSLSYSIDEACKRRIELYLECSTYDLLIVSYWPNRSALQLGDILKLGIGVKYDL